MRPEKVMHNWNCGFFEALVHSRMYKSEKKLIVQGKKSRGYVGLVKGTSSGMVFDDWVCVRAFANTILAKKERRYTKLFCLTR